MNAGTARLRRALGQVALALCAAGLAHAAAGGTVTGTVVLEGPPPNRPPMPVYKHQEVCGDGVVDERLLVGPGGGVRFAVVTVEGPTGGRPPATDTGLVLDNLACRFQPHVQTAEVGQTIELRNGDPVIHNVDARLGQETLFNIALPPGRHVRRVLDRPGLVAITCDVRHTWMSAFVVVGAVPYHTVTDVYGAYEIPDVPPGSYTLRVWHEVLGTVTRPLTVEVGKTATVDVAFPPPAATPPAEPGH